MPRRRGGTPDPRARARHSRFWRQCGRATVPRRPLPDQGPALHHRGRTAHRGKPVPQGSRQPSRGHDCARDAVRAGRFREPGPDELTRARARSHDRARRVGRDAQPVGSLAHAGRFQRRLGGRGRGRSRPGRPRERRRRLHPHPRGRVRARRAEAVARARLVRTGRRRAVPDPLRAARRDSHGA